MRRKRRRYPDLGPERTRASERGAAIAYFAFLMAALVGVSGFVVDGGRLWSQRRVLVAATDAAALAGAAAASELSTACDEAYSYLLANATAVASQTCTPKRVGRAGIIEVSATQEVDYLFASVLGLDQGVAKSTSAASWFDRPLPKARPFVICEKASPELIAWLNSPDSDSFTLRLYVSSDHAVAQCSADGSAPGNWGTVNFDDGSNSLDKMRDWVEFGYEEGVYTSSAQVTCEAEPFGCYPGDPGSISPSLNTVMDAFDDLGEPVPIILYSSAESSGSNLQFRFSKVALGSLSGYKLNGANSQRYLEFTFEPELLQDGDPPDFTSICGNTIAECETAG